MLSYLVVLNSDHVELFGCSGSRPCGVIWFVLDSDHVELFSCSGIFVAFIVHKKHNMVDELIRVLNFYYV